MAKHKWKLYASLYPFVSIPCIKLFYLMCFPYWRQCEMKGSLLGLVAFLYTKTFKQFLRDNKSKTKQHHHHHHYHHHHVPPPPKKPTKKKKKKKHYTDKQQAKKKQRTKKQKNKQKYRYSNTKTTQELLPLAQ